MDLFYVGLVFLGLVVGCIGAYVGIGGGSIISPTLILIGIDPHMAAGTSLAVVFFTGLSSAIAYARKRLVDWKIGLILELSLFPGGYVGSRLTGITASQTMKKAYTILLFALSAYMWVSQSRRKGEETRDPKYRINLSVALPLSFIAGLSSGFFGIGGGVIKVPLLTFLGMPVHNAVATSTFMIMITSIGGLMGHIHLGNVNPIYALAIAPGIFLGAQCGSKLAYKSKPEMVAKIFSIVLITIAFSILLRGRTGRQALLPCMPTATPLYGIVQ